ALFCNRELVHQSEAEVVFFGGEIDGEEAAAEVLFGFPTDLTAQAGFVTGSPDAFNVAEESKQDGFGEVPAIRTEARGQLRRDQAHHRTPRFKGSRLILGPSSPSDLGDLVRGNKIANLPQNAELRRCWVD